MPRSEPGCARLLPMSPRSQSYKHRRYSTRNSKTRSISPRSLAARTSSLLRQIVIPARRNAMPVRAAHAVPNGIQSTGWSQRIVTSAGRVSPPQLAVVQHMSYDCNLDPGSGIVAPLCEVRRLSRSMEDRAIRASIDCEQTATAAGTTGSRRSCRLQLHEHKRVLPGTEPISAASTLAEAESLDDGSGERPFARR